MTSPKFRVDSPVRTQKIKWINHVEAYYAQLVKTVAQKAQPAHNSSANPQIISQ